MDLSWFPFKRKNHGDIPYPSTPVPLDEILQDIYRINGFISRKSNTFLEPLYGLYHCYPGQVKDICYLAQILWNDKHKKIAEKVAEIPGVAFEWYVKARGKEKDVVRMLAQKHAFVEQIDDRCRNKSPVEKHEMRDRIKHKESIPEWLTSSDATRLWVSTNETVRLWAYVLAHRQWPEKDMSVWADFANYGGYRWKCVFEKEQLEEEDFRSLLVRKSLTDKIFIDHDVSAWILVDELLRCSEAQWGWDSQAMRERTLKNVMDIWSWAQSMDDEAMRNWVKGNEGEFNHYVALCLKMWQPYSSAIYEHPQMVAYRDGNLRSLNVHPKHAAILWSQSQNSWWKDKLHEVQDLDGLSDTVIVKMFDWFMSQGQEWPLFQNYEHPDKEKWWLCYAVTGSMVDAYEMVNKGEESIIDEDSIYL